MKKLQYISLVLASLVIYFAVLLIGSGLNAFNVVLFVIGLSMFTIQVVTLK